MLLDANTGSVLGTLVNNDLSETQYSENALSINTQGIGSKLCKLQLGFNYGKDGGAAIYNSYETKSKGINKKNYQLNSYNGEEVVKSFALSQNYPNQFNPTTIIHYEIPNDGLVTLKIYDELGKEVKTLVNQYQNKGKYDINFNASQLSSGIYFYQLKTGNDISIKKMILLK